MYLMPIMEVDDHRAKWTNLLAKCSPTVSLYVTPLGTFAACLVPSRLGMHHASHFGNRCC